MYCHGLDDPLHYDEVGAKAGNLSLMKRNGFPVPHGFVVSRRAFDDRFDAARFRMVLDEIAYRAAELRGERVIVRSSAIGEDSADASFAGQLESIHCGRDIESIAAALRRCWESYDKENVRVYQQRTGVSLRGMGVVVQELVEPDYAGVLFTRSPGSDRHMLCEYLEGDGEKLVSGAVDPMRFECGRADGASDAQTPFDFDPLYAHAVRLESLFGHPLDIEWVMKKGEWSIVQSRPITVRTNGATGRRVHWSNTNVNENYPGPITPLLYSIAREAYYHYFKNLSRLLQVPDEAIRELEPDYANIIGAHGCRMYYNMTSIHNVIGRSPFARLLRGAFDNFVGYQEGEKSAARTTSARDVRRFATRFVALDLGLEKSVREFERRADEFDGVASDAHDLASLRAAFHSFIELRMHGWYHASLADFFAMVYHGLLGRFCRRYFGEESQGIHNTIIQAIPGLVSSQPVAEIWRIARMIADDREVAEIFRRESATVVLERLQEERFAAIEEAIDSYLRAWGFRCSGELMLTEDCYLDAPEKFIDLLRGYIDTAGENPERIIEAKARERERLMRDLRRRIMRRRGLLAPLAIVEVGALELLVRLCFTGIASRERVRLKQAMVYYRFKVTLGRIGRELLARGVLDAEGDLLFLRYQEIAELLATSDMLSRSLKEIVSTRKSEFERTSRLRFPDDFSSIEGEHPTPERVARSSRTDDGGGLRGLSACGGIIRGRARVLESVLEADRIERGDILVTRQTDPGWATVFPLISGLVVERGGMLSHGAIVAREFGIPAVVGVARAAELIVDGEEIEVDGDRGEVRRNP